MYSIPIELNCDSRFDQLTDSECKELLDNIRHLTPGVMADTVVLAYNTSLYFPFQLNSIVMGSPRNSHRKGARQSASRRNPPRDPPRGRKVQGARV